MDIFRQGPLGIFWGGRQTCLIAKDDKGFGKFCDQLRNNLKLDQIVVLDQEHGIAGYCTDTGLTMPTSVYEHKGDWLITSKNNVGIVALSADCLPIVLYDVRHNLLGVAHAGWKGSVQKIAQVLLEAMCGICDAKPEEIKVYLGPAAKQCCYEVSQEFVSNIPQGYKSEDFFVQHKGKLFFDNGLLCEKILMNSGIISQNINKEFNVCTMCDGRFYSARVDKNMLRNLTVAFLSKDM